MVLETELNGKLTKHTMRQVYTALQVKHVAKQYGGIQFEMQLKHELLEYDKFSTGSTVCRFGLFVR